MCTYPQVHMHTHRHTSSPKRLIIAVKKPHPTTVAWGSPSLTLGSPLVSGPHAITESLSSAPWSKHSPGSAPHPAQNSNPKASARGPPAQAHSLWPKRFTEAASNRHRSSRNTEDTARERQQAPKARGPPSSRPPDTDRKAAPGVRPAPEDGQRATPAVSTCLPEARARPCGPESLPSTCPTPEGPPEKGHPEQGGGRPRTVGAAPGPWGLPAQAFCPPSLPHSTQGQQGEARPDTMEVPGGRCCHGPSWGRATWLAPTHAHHPPWLPTLGGQLSEEPIPGQGALPLGRPASHMPGPWWHWAIQRCWSLQLPWIPLPGRAHRACVPGSPNEDILSALPSTFRSRNRQQKPWKPDP